MLFDAKLGIPSAPVLLLLFSAAVILSTFIHAVTVYRKRPGNLPVLGRTLLCGKWLSALDFLFRGSDTILHAYNQTKAHAFAIPALREYQVLVKSPQAIQELARCPKHIFSFHAAMKDRLSHKQIMYGFEHNDIDPHDSVPIHAMKVLLRKNLGAMGPVIERRVEEGTEAYLKKAGSYEVSVFSLAKAITGRVNNQVLFGDELATDEEFEKDSLQYGYDGAIAMELCRLLPGPLARLVGPLVMARSGAMRRVGQKVNGLVQKRAASRGVEKEQTEYLDCTEFVMAASRTPRQRSVERVTQQMVALLFASAHQLPMALAWAIIMLGEHPNLIPLLRQEIDAVERQGDSIPVRELRVMDSFLRESSRLNPLDALSVQRKALKPYSFSSGVQVPAGNLVAIPQQALMRDAAHYAHPEIFDVFRFYSKKDSDEAAQKYTDVNWKYPFWGSPAQSCPGRWYAADVLKFALVHLLKTYDFDLIGHDSSRPLIWTTAIVPRFDVKIALRPQRSMEESQLHSGGLHYGALGTTYVEQ